MRKVISFTFISLLFIAFAVVIPLPCNAADNRVSALKAARVLALRNLVETFYGTKLRFVEEANGANAGNFFNITMTKSGRRNLRGVEYIEKYDPSTGIAQVTAELALKNMANVIDPARFDLKKDPDMVIRRTAFAASDNTGAAKVSAFRAAELDAYKNLYKLVCGFKLSSQSKVQNSILQSDVVKATVIGAILGAKVYGIGWQGKGKDAIAIIKLRIKKKDLEQALGKSIVGVEDKYIAAKGRAAAGIRRNLGSGGRSTAKSLLNTSPITDDDSDDMMP